MDCVTAAADRSLESVPIAIRLRWQWEVQAFFDDRMSRLRLALADPSAT